jgi:hypothetical protein
MEKPLVSTLYERGVAVVVERNGKRNVIRRQKMADTIVFLGEPAV